ncbi:MAG: hypothetical protein Unbinned4585contig1001_17 [Prokaryotic dsDNA virus sp.]|nr:MAG: hypothetical protein Unbinned4585contig1001_17 [Prokaryotic dsDNA virus sp.]|tara:strand:+ start:36 stop:689 length:654 start_codon:yes stop_codon:yes gene_type:complete
MEGKRNKLGFTEVSIDKLIKADWNYKTEDLQKSKKLKENIKRNGQVENILIRELETGDFEVVNGNHRLDVFRDLGIKKVMGYNFGIISQQQAMRIAIETNETKFDSDSIVLAERIKELTEEFNLDDLVSTLPYNENEILNFKTLTDFDWSQYDSDEVDTFGDTEYDKEIKFKVTEETFQRWQELKDRFQTIIGYENESKVFEFAIIEALNMPIESIK